VSRNASLAVARVDSSAVIRASAAARRSGTTSAASSRSRKAKISSPPVASLGREANASVSTFGTCSKDLVYVLANRSNSARAVETSAGDVVRNTRRAAANAP